MKRYLATILSIVILSSFMRDKSEEKFKHGEFLKYRMHYGFLNAGYATLSLEDTIYNNKPHYYVVGKGYSTGLVSAFFKVDDTYETYIDKDTYKPSHFVRKLDEGGYTKDLFIDFDSDNKKVIVNDLKNKTITKYGSEGEIQDLISAFYRLRIYDTDPLKNGDFIYLDIFLDDNVMRFKLGILARETIRCKYGKIKCIKIRPYVESGRVFKAKEGVTMWVTDDKNHIPIQIKADLAVGSLKADIDEIKNLNYPIKFN